MHTHTHTHTYTHRVKLLHIEPEQPNFGHETEPLYLVMWTQARISALYKIEIAEQIDLTKFGEFSIYRL